MQNKNKVKTLILLISLSIMLIADYGLGDEAGFFNLYHLLLTIFSESDKNYIYYQEGLGAFALPAALTAASLFHLTIANIIYRLLNLIKWRNHEKV